MDERPDELLEQAGRTASRLGLAVTWTDAIAGEGAKACTGTGVRAWKSAKVISPDGDFAAGFYRRRCRKRNPAVVASGSGLVLLELDGPDSLLDRFGIDGLPATVSVRSRRGLHRYYRPPKGRPPVKVQLAEEGATVSSDGYLVAPPALHPTGLVYSYTDNNEIAVLPVDVYDLVVELGRETRARTTRVVENGGPIETGQRNETLFHLALEQVRAGASAAKILERLLEANQRCVPPLDEPLVRKQYAGAVKWAATHPTATERARAEAQRILGERRAGIAPSARPGSKSAKRRRALRRSQISSISAKRVEYLIDKQVPLSLVLVAGVGGLGKSALGLFWGAQVTLAGRDVLIVSYEDAAAEVLRPRVEALGADLDRVHVLSVDVLEGGISFPTDLPELDRHVRETNAAMVLIDPVSAAIDLKLDAHRDQDVRVVLGQLAKLTEREPVAVVEIAHLNKSPSNDPYLRINGSTAFYNAARSVITVTPDPADPDWLRLVTHHKSNYGPLADVERWRVEPVSIPSESGPIETMKLGFVEIAEGVSREDVLAPKTMDKTEEAVEFLVGTLADGEWHDSAGLVILAGSRRISERTLRRAALEALRVEHERRGFPSTTWWRLPSRATPSSPDLA